METVFLQIFDSSNNLVEEGNAVLHPETDNWIYTVTTPNDIDAGGKIVVRASDLPGNISSFEVVLPG